jgi:hypothetical protein
MTLKIFFTLKTINHALRTTQRNTAQHSATHRNTPQHTLFQILKKLPILILLIITNQTLNAQGFCGSIGSSNSANFSPNAITPNINTCYKVQLFVHVIRQTDGTGGVNDTQVQTGIDIIKTDFAQFKISFAVIGRDEIWNDDFYDGNPGSLVIQANLINASSVSNAINIYLFPTTNRPTGYVTNIPSNAMFVSGSQLQLGQQVDFCTSRVMSHEMGHCLGLFHTHRGSPSESGAGICAELVNNTGVATLNGLTCGDLVWDTPADPGYLQATSTRTACEYVPTPPALDPTGKTYAPDPYQIMSINYPLCVNTLSVGQGERMRKFLANDPILQQCLVQEAPTYNINGDITWNTYIANQDITIPAGKKLTITGTLYMSQDKKIIVQQGGTLVVNGGTITNYCDNTWDGIQVWGNGVQNWSNKGSANFINATIEHASEAIRPYDPSNPTSTYGGIISADNTIFRNNKRDMDVSGWSTEGWFTNCTFEVNNAFRFNEIEPRVSLSNSNYSTTYFFGCKFKNNYTNDVNNFYNGVTNYVGIDCKDCGLYIDAQMNNPSQKSLFDNFYVGIRTLRLSNDNWIYISNSIFDRNFIGLLSGGVNFLYITNNEFKVGGTGFPVGSWYKAGLALFTGTGYNVINNNFTGKAGGSTPYTFGTLVSNTGYESNNIEYNKYIGLYAGNRILGTNRDMSAGVGLQLRCSDHTSNIYDNVVELGDGIATFQGTPLESEGNLFSINGGAPDYYNGSYSPINRYYVPGVRTFATIGGSTIINQNISQATGCNTTIGVSQMRQSQNSMSTTLSEQDRGTLVNNYDSKNALLNTYSTKHKSLMDGGNTNATIANIKTKWRKDAVTLRTNISALSPNLSSDVLFEVANTGVLSQTELMDVLIANIGSCKNKLFLENLTRDIPKPLTLANIEKLKTMPIPTSERLDLEIKIHKTKDEVMTLGRSIIRDINKSKGKYNVDTLRNWLKKMNTPHMYYARQKRISKSKKVMTLNSL